MLLSRQYIQRIKNHELHSIILRKAIIFIGSEISSFENKSAPKNVTIVAIYSLYSTIFSKGFL